MSYTSSQAILGDGSTLGMGDSPSGPFTPFGEITKLSLPKGPASKVKVTNMESPNKTHEYIGGFIEPGEVDCDMNWLKADYILARQNKSVQKYFQILIPVDGGSGDYEEVFPGFIMDVEGDVPVESQVTAKLKIQVTGASDIS